MASTRSQQPQKENVIQVSTWQFQSLLASVNKLNDAVTKLKQKNEALESELTASLSKLEEQNKVLNELNETVSKIEKENQDLKNHLSTQHKNDRVFTFFLKLPRKVRLRIWQFAARRPQLHIISKDRASRSKINSVYNSCVEARQAIKELQLDYFLFSSETSHGNFKSQMLRTVRNYVNLDVDTIWLTGEHEDDCLPKEVHWVCGKCHRNSLADQWNNGDHYYGCGGWGGSERFCISSQSGYIPHHIFRLAINYSSWVNPTRAVDNAQRKLGTIKILLKYSVKELLLAVGDFEHLKPQRDIDFITPSLRPPYVKHAITEAEKQEWEALARQKTWDKIRSELRKVMQKAKDEEMHMAGRASSAVGRYRRYDSSRRKCQVETGWFHQARGRGKDKKRLA